MDEFPDLKWRIDAWDSLAGRAFLCRRLPDGGADPRLDQPAIFVAPPFFQPEPLASRSPGFAATRGTFQSGFFIGGHEVGFATLDDAIAFIRRGYSSPGSEPFPGAPITRRVGPEGRGGSGLALELPELPITPGFKQLDHAIAERMYEFTAQSLGITPGSEKTHLMDWRLPNPEVLKHGRELLSAAATELMLELLRRFPPWGPSTDHSAWLDSAHRLGQQLVRMGLWDDVQHKCATALARLPFVSLAAVFSRGLPAMYVGNLKDDPSDLLELLFFGLNWRFSRRWELERGEEINVYDDLALFPLPDSMRDRYHSFRDSTPTVLTLLSAWFAHPMSVKDATELDRALLLFGGSCVAVSVLRRESPAYRPSMMDMNQHLRNAFFLRLAEEAWKWISKQLPDRAFEHRLEELLQEIPQIWTEAAYAGASHLVHPDKPAEELSSYEIEILRNALGESATHVEEEEAAAGYAVS
jgi:hypothetical protein